MVNNRISYRYIILYVAYHFRTIHNLAGIVIIHYEQSLSTIRFEHSNIKLYIEINGD